MKKIIIIALLCAIASSLKAQYTVEVETWASDPSKDVWVYVGGLPPSDGGALQKLKVEVFGGQYINSTGETTFYITVRDVLSVNETRQGGTSSNQFTLRAFTNPSNGFLDFYIYTPGNTFAAYAVRSTLVGGTRNDFNLTGNGSAQQLFPCTVQALVPPALPSSGAEQSLTINPVFITDAAGNIGINTLTPDPAYKLSVNGSIRAKEVKVEAGWADYVFDKGYELKPLKEVEDYINRNKHLPGVPSAAAVEKNGVNVGETEALLLKKIEELTLYLIDLKKDNDDIKKKNQALTEQLRQILTGKTYK